MVVLQVNSSFPPSTRTMTESGNLTIVQLGRDDAGLYHCIIEPCVDQTLMAQLGREDAGLYECIASNHIATVVTSTLLIIERTNSSAVN